jgi:hypothetical protein
VWSSIIVVLKKDDMVFLFLEIPRDEWASDVSMWKEILGIL